MKRFTHFAKAGLVVCLFFISGSVFSQQLSDSVIKKNVTPIVNPLNNLVQLQPMVYEYDRTRFRDLRLPAGRQYGFMEEDVQALFPDLVGYKNYSYAIGKNTFRTARIKTLDTESLIPILVASIKQQQTEIEQLKAAVKALKSEMSSRK